jgi:hypothetical protein
LIAHGGMIRTEALPDELRRVANTMHYMSPEEIGTYGNGPTRWDPTEILYRGEPGGWSAAEGIYNGEPRLGLRWNGDDNSRGFPTAGAGRRVWFVVPSELEEAVRVAVKAMVLWDRFRNPRRRSARQTKD